MYLIIDTSSSEKVFVALCQGNILISKISYLAKVKQSEKLLEIIDKLLIKNKAKPSQLKGIIVVRGPGSFVGLRVGLTVANFFSYVLNIPIVGIKKGEFKDVKGLIEKGNKKIQRAKPQIILPYYGEKLRLKNKKMR